MKRGNLKMNFKNQNTSCSENGIFETKKIFDKIFRVFKFKI